MYIGVCVKYPLFLSDWIFLDRFSKNIQMSNFMNICPVEANLFQADRWTDMTKLIVTFHNFSNAPKNGWIIQINMFTNILNCYKIKQQWKLLSGRIHRTVFNRNQKTLIIIVTFERSKLAELYPQERPNLYSVLTKPGTSFFLHTKVSTWHMHIPLTYKEI
jgi:hypothetical protein